MKNMDRRVALAASVIGAGISNAVTDEMRIPGQPFWLRVLIGTLIVVLAVWLASLIFKQKSRD